MICIKICIKLTLSFYIRKPRKSVAILRAHGITKFHSWPICGYKEAFKQIYSWRQPPLMFRIPVKVTIDKTSRNYMGHLLRKKLRIVITLLVQEEQITLHKPRLSLF